MQKTRTRKRWIWLAGVAGLTVILMLVQNLLGPGRSGKTQKT